MIYSIKEPKEDKRSFLGRQVDWAGGLFLIWLLTFFFIASLTAKPATALISSIPLLAAEALVFKKYLQIRSKKKQHQRRLWSAGQKMIKKFKSMDPESEFKPYVLEVIAGLNGFQNVRLVSLENKLGAHGQWDFDFIGDYRGAKVAILCKYPAGDNKISPNVIRTFAGALKLEEIKNGLIVSCGEYEPGVARVAAELSRKGINIKLIGRNKLIELSKQSNPDGPAEQQNALKTAPLTAGKLTMSFTTIKDTILSSRPKAKSYFSYGLLLYAGYILLSGTTKLSLIYLAFAVMNFLLGAGCLYLGRNFEDKDPLAGLGEK